MKFPSSNTDSANPALNDIVSNVSSSHGVRLTGGSTGGIVEPAGDDANITLKVRGKGTGGVVIGNSSQAVTVGSGNAGVAAVNKYTVQFTAPALSSGFAAGASAAASTFTVAGLSTGTVLMFTPTNPINTLYNLRAYCSTAAELNLVFSHNGISTLGSGESTNRGVLVEFKF